MRSGTIGLSFGLTIAAASAFVGGMIVHLLMYGGDSDPLRFFWVSGGIALFILIPAAVVLVISMIEKRPVTVLTGRAVGWFLLFTFALALMMGLPFATYGVIYFAPVTFLFAFGIGLPVLLIAAGIINGIARRKNATAPPAHTDHA